MDIKVNVQLMHRQEQADLNDALKAIFDSLDEFRNDNHRLRMTNSMLRRQIRDLGHDPVEALNAE